MPPGRTASRSQSGMPCCGAEPAGAPAILTQRAARGESGRLWRRSSRACRRRLMSGKLSLPSGMVFLRRPSAVAWLGSPRTARIYRAQNSRDLDTNKTPIQRYAKELEAQDFGRAPTRHAASRCLYARAGAPLLWPSSSVLYTELAPQQSTTTARTSCSTVLHHQRARQGPRRSWRWWEWW